MEQFFPNTFSSLAFSVCKKLTRYHSVNVSVIDFNPFQPSVTFPVEASHLVCTANQITGFNMKCSISGLDRLCARCRLGAQNLSDL